MGIFNYRGQDASDLTNIAYRMSVFDRYDELGYEDLEQRGWSLVTPDDLGLWNLVQDSDGFYKNFLTLDAQAQVYAHVDGNGNIDQLSVTFSGGTNFFDGLDSFQFLSETYDDGFDYLLDAVKDFAIDNGLTGSDVLFTGYSNGGSATNLVAAESDTSFGGFFANSDFIAFEPLVIHDDEDKILNIAYENSVLFGIYGETGNTALEARTADITYDSATDNFILFNSDYADPNFPDGNFSVLNSAAYSAHGEGFLQADEVPITERITNSEYYDYTSVDSTLIISGLPEEDRSTIWVEDAPRITSDHYGNSYFAIGSETADLLGDGAGSDYLDGAEGDDQFRLGLGNDHVAGGEGVDEVQLSGTLSDYEVFRLSDGTIYFNDTTGTNGLEELTEVETVDFAGADYTLDTTGLIQGGSVAATYTSATEGTSGSDVLSGTSSANNIFAGSGSDVINGHGGSDLLHGADGNDTISGGSGVDQLFGEAGDDTLSGGYGDDTLSGGIGNDTFVFNVLSGDDVITDFNTGANDQDILSFSSLVFSSAQAAYAAATQVGDDIVINYGLFDSLTLANVDIGDLSENSFAIS